MQARNSAASPPPSPPSAALESAYAMRKIAPISLRYLAEKEFLRYDLLMQLADGKTVFKWIPSDLKRASVALLDMQIFNAREALPANCVCIWISESASYPGRKGDMTLPLNFSLSDLVNALDRAALRLLDMKTIGDSPDMDADPFSQKNYRISKWISLEHDFSTVRFKKILAVMTKQTVNWRWLLTYGGLTERDAYLFLDELKKKSVLVEGDMALSAHELITHQLARQSSQQISLEQREGGVGLFVKKINQWLGRARSQELERTP
ncbi:hypothetical protein [Collimonas sp. OK242]|jgi:hypothetical protein|uniref:hypothetical protein n=1 Tax=Collimonas sp. OK242 TaxID=1798195 RepID=UPI00115FB6D7|nr:hypothetical protein [Collimonas sp. OK242]